MSLQLDSGRGVVEFAVVGDESFGNSLSDSVDLGSVSTSRNTDTDVDFAELVFTNYQNWFVDFVTEDFGVDEIDWRAVDSDESTALLGMSNRGGGLW